MFVCACSCIKQYVQPSYGCRGTPAVAGVTGYLAPLDILHPHSKYPRVFGTPTPNMLGYLAPPTVAPARLRARAASLRSTAPVFISKLHLIFITRRQFIDSTLVLCKGYQICRGDTILRIISMVAWGCQIS